MDHPIENFRESRRSFLKKTTIATFALTGTNSFNISIKKESQKMIPENETPWHRRITRWGQTNITEKDPSRYDITWWRNYWKLTRTEGIIVNAGGIVAYYPSQIPLHKQAEFLEGRDLFGELLKAAHDDGLAVFARMDSNRANKDFYNAHPDWFAINQQGSPFKAGELYITCINGPYYEEHIPSILKEITSLYHPEGFTDNSWSGMGRDSICYCENCRKSFRRKKNLELPLQKDWNNMAYREWIRWSYERRLEIWDLNNRITKSAGGEHCIWSGMNSGTVSGQSRSFRDYREICQRADIIMLDSQVRSNDGGFQQNGNTGKLIHGLLGWDKLIPESMAMYQAGSPTFRLSAKPASEARMWMTEGIAGGIQPWWHHVGAYHEDRRMYKTAEPVMTWHEKNKEYLINRQPVASVGVVWSQQNTDFFGRDNPESLVDLPYRGITQALIRARIPYLPVHADHITRDSAQFSALILPNTGSLTEGQVTSIRKFVDNGGNLLATGFTSLFDDQGDPLEDFALGNLFGAHIQGNITEKVHEKIVRQAESTLHTYLRLTPERRAQVFGPKTGNEPVVKDKRHDVLSGFDETDILPFGGQLESLKTDPGVQVIMTFIPPFPIYPPETAWMREPKTDIPGLILNELKNNSRIAFMPADIDRQFAMYNLPDHGNLLANLVNWITEGDIPLEVEGPGLVDCHLYHQTGRLILHIVNLTSTGTWRQPIDELITVGPLHIRIKLPAQVKGNHLRLLVSGQQKSATRKNGWCQFEIPSISDHEVIVIS